MESWVNMYGSEFSVRFPDLKYWDNQQLFVRDFCFDHDRVGIKHLS